MPISPESAVKKLSRLPSNCICANCGTTSKYGFSTVCIKYLTFVCNSCKSSHQAVSHRCKSLTMSSWDQGEVLKLKIHGNDYARKVWLANAPPVGAGGRPKEGDDINVFKRFVVEAYENKRYYREPSADGGKERAEEANAPFPSLHANHAPRRPVAMPKPAPAPPKQQRRPAPVVPAPAPPPAPTLDLLDFGAFDTAVAPATLPPQQAAQVPATSNIAAAPDSDPFFDPFNNNTQNSNNVSAGSNMVHGNPAVDTNNTIPYQSSSEASFASPGAFNNAGSSTTSASFDPFGDISISTTRQSNNNGQQPPQKVVMKTPVTVMNSSGGVMNEVMNNSNQSNMMMNGSMMANNTKNPMMNGMMHRANSMAANSNMMNMGNVMMANGGMGSSMMNNSMMMMNGGMMNNNENMMNMNGSMSGSVTQQQQPLPAMNINVMQPMNNSISNNFEMRSAAVASFSTGSGGSTAAKPSQKPDPFAGLGF